MTTARTAERPAAQTFFLPDFCAPPTVLAVVLIAGLVGLVVTLVRPTSPTMFWTQLAGASLYLLWLGLTCSAVLCRARPYLQRMSIRRANLIALTLLLVTIAIVAEAVYQVGQLWGHAGNDVIASFFPQQHSSFLLRSIAVGFIVSGAALRYFHVSAEWKHTIQLEALARIHALQARIRPHFLFNSMNTIAALTRSSPKHAEQAVEDLADLFRATLSEANARITLQEEFEIARTHQRIEQLRLGERLQVQWDIDALPPRALVPSLIVQPLLENAVYHGVETLPEGGTVTITGRHNGDVLHIEVRNPIAESTHEPARPGNHMALTNIRERLELAWPQRASVDTWLEGREFCARLTFPYAAADSGHGDTLPAGRLRP